MPNEEYQRLLRADAGELRRRLEVVADDLEDDELLHTFRDLGGHDLGALLDGYRQADAVRDRPSVVFAYTIKGWRLPTEGHPANHSALLNARAVRAAGGGAGRRPGGSVGDVRGRLAGGRAVRERGAAPGAARRARRPPRRRRVPDDLGREHKGTASTQQAFGRFFVDLVREAPEVAERVVTVSPDVGTSTNLGGWINKAGIWNPGDRIDWFADDTDTLVRWRETDHGRHIELGIAEVNLVGLLGELGATWSRDGQPLLPVGTIYDPFVARALEPWSFGIYAGGQSILVGTPSGVTLGPEGGAHQSVITPSIGIEQPGCTFWEPAFGQDLEWTFLHALSRLGREDGEAAYFRLSTRPIDQSLAQRHARGGAERRLPAAPGRRPARGDRGHGRAGARGGRGGGHPAQGGRRRGRGRLHHERRPALPLLPGPRRAWPRATRRTLDRLFPHDAPVITLLDGHPHTLSFLGDVCLGVQRFGQSGDLAELYEHHAIDAESVVGAALDLMG